MRIWTLFKETNIQQDGETAYYRKERAFETYTDFELAKEAFRAAIKRYVAQENAIFDGEGRYLEMDEDLLSLAEDETEAADIGETLRAFFLGENVEDRITKITSYKPGKVVVFRSDANDVILFADKPETDANNPESKIREPFEPYVDFKTIETNALIMSDPHAKYYFRANTALDAEDLSVPPAYIHIELIPTEVQPKE